MNYSFINTIVLGGAVPYDILQPELSWSLKRSFFFRTTLTFHLLYAVTISSIPFVVFFWFFFIVWFFTSGPSFNFYNVCESTQVGCGRNEAHQATNPVTHRSRCVSEIDLESPHGTNDGDDRLNSVAVDNSFVLFALLLRVACLMDDSIQRDKSHQ